MGGYLSLIEGGRLGGRGREWKRGGETAYFNGVYRKTVIRQKTGAREVK